MCPIKYSLTVLALNIQKVPSNKYYGIGGAHVT